MQYPAQYATTQKVTHFILRIHLGTCLDQHPACGLVAIPGSEMERGVLALRREERVVCDMAAERGMLAYGGRIGLQQQSLAQHGRSAELSGYRRRAIQYNSAASMFSP